MLRNAIYTKGKQAVSVKVHGFGTEGDSEETYPVAIIEYEDGYLGATYVGNIKLLPNRNLAAGKAYCDTLARYLQVSRI